MVGWIKGLLAGAENLEAYITATLSNGLTDKSCEANRT